MKKFRELYANEIECRVATCKSSGLSLLLYKDARCDMNILDETVGVMNWQREHKELKGNIYCGVSIYDEDLGRWATKWDCGKESNTEAEKGESSDSFKRACFNWGIGRALYTAPYIWIPSDKCAIKPSGRKDKYGNEVLTCTDKFVVEQIIYEEGCIVAISIRNKTQNKRVFAEDYRKKEQ